MGRPQNGNAPQVDSFGLGCKARSRHFEQFSAHYAWETVSRCGSNNFACSLAFINLSTSSGVSRTTTHRETSVTRLACPSYDRKTYHTIDYRLGIWNKKKITFEMVRLTCLIGPRMCRPANKGIGMRKGLKCSKASQHKGLEGSALFASDLKAIWKLHRYKRGFRTDFVTAFA